MGGRGGCLVPAELETALGTAKWCCCSLPARPGGGRGQLTDVQAAAVEGRREVHSDLGVRINGCKHRCWRVGQGNANVVTKDADQVRAAVQQRRLQQGPPAPPAGLLLASPILGGAGGWAAWERERQRGGGDVDATEEQVCIRHGRGCGTPVAESCAALITHASIVFFALTSEQAQECACPIPWTAPGRRRERRGR